jgi:bacillithiol system protein YtxJ
MFQKLFNSDKPSRDFSTFNWVPMQNVAQIAELKEQSKTKTVFIFKHSTRCGISRSVIRQFENLFKDSSNHCVFYYLDLLNYRSVSNEISDEFGVIHQSPQMLIIKNETAVVHESHYDILEVDLSRFV